MTTVHAQTGIKLATKPAKTSLLGGHFIYRANGTTETPSSANVVEWVDNDPTLWRHNVHIGSNGIKLRYGETTLSKWDTSSLIFYKPNTTNGVTTVSKGIEITNLGIDVFSGQSGQEQKVASFGEEIILGAIENGKTRTIIYDEGFRFIRRNTNGADSILVNFKVNNAAYGTNPVFTMGSRKVPTNANIYDNTKTYKIGDVCIYSDTNYVCKEDITTAENFDSSKWKKIEGENSFAFGYQVIAAGQDSMATGYNTKAIDSATHAEGSNTIAVGSWSHAEGSYTVASGSYSHAEGRSTIACGNFSHAEGNSTTASGNTSHSEGDSTTAEAIYSHAEGTSTTASSISAHAEGYHTTASGDSSHSEGYYTTASGDYSHAGGRNTTASNDGAYAEGYYTTASGNSSHSEGYYTTANGDYSHAEGSNTTASGSYSHAEGYQTQASGNYSHAEGYYTQANGNYSHAMGNNTIAAGAYQTVMGQYNVSNSSAPFIIGNGSSTNNRSNLFTVNNAGDLEVSSNFWIINKADSNNYLKISSSNLEFFKNVGGTSTSIASFGSTSRIGPLNNKHISIDSNGMYIYTGSESSSTQVASFTGSQAMMKSSSGQITIDSTGFNVTTIEDAKGAYLFNGEPLLKVIPAIFVLDSDVASKGEWKIYQTFSTDITDYYTVLGIVGYNFDKYNSSSGGMSYFNVWECSLPLRDQGTSIQFQARNMWSNPIKKGIKLIVYLLAMPKNPGYDPSSPGDGSDETDTA